MQMKTDICTVVREFVFSMTVTPQFQSLSLSFTMSKRSTCRPPLRLSQTRLKYPMMARNLISVKHACGTYVRITTAVRGQQKKKCRSSPRSRRDLENKKESGNPHVLRQRYSKSYDITAQLRWRLSNNLQKYQILYSSLSMPPSAFP